MAVGQVINSILTVMLIGFPGFIVGKILKEDNISDGLTFFAINVCVPALIVKALQIDYTADMMLSFLKTFVYNVPILIISALMTYVFAKICRYSKQRLTLLFCVLIASNTGFVGIPLCLQLYGEESMFYAASCEVVNDILMYSVVLSVIAIGSGNDVKLSAKAILINPPIIALIIGITFFVCRIHLPECINQALGYFSGATAPALLFVLGMRLSKLKAADFVCDWSIYGVCALRLVVLPLFVYLVVRVFLGDTSLFGKVFIIMAAMPAGAAISMLAINYKSDTEFAVKCVTLSTVLCIITSPVWALIL